MKSDKIIKDPESPAGIEPRPRMGKAKRVLESNIGDSIDLLVEYLVENGVKDIHPFIMGEVEKRLIIKVLERTRGNKIQAAKCLGMNRNTFRKKIQKLIDSQDPAVKEPKA
jgi:DNA-binding protein Fis